MTRMSAQKNAYLSDIHGNAPALEAVLQDVQANGCQRLFVLGDIINGVAPKACLDLLYSWAAQAEHQLLAIKGNAEEYLLTPDLDQCPLKAEPFYSLLIRQLKWWHDRLSPAELSWLRSLPEVLIWEDALIVHDDPYSRLVPPEAEAGQDPKYRLLSLHFNSVLPDIGGVELGQVLGLLEERKLNISITGHSHVPFIRGVGQKLLCNVGSAGMPLDGDWRSSWVLQTGNKLELRRVPYNLQELFQMMDAVEDYPDYEDPNLRLAYKQGYASGQHRNDFLNK